MDGRIVNFTCSEAIVAMGGKIIRTRGKEHYFICPQCGHECSCTDKFFNCFHCDLKGTGVDYARAVEPMLDDKAAKRKIFAILNGEEAPKFYEERKKAEEKAVTEAVKKSKEECSTVYYAMLRLLKLSEDHKINLLERGMSESDIQRFRFRTTPKDTRGLCNLLRRQGFDLAGVPGFYLDRGEWNLRIPAQGFLCPVFDGTENLILGFQIRADKPINGNKYLWVSSAGREQGCTSGAQTCCLPGKSDSMVIITEGILKATTVYSLLEGSVTVVGVPGVKCLDTMNDYLEKYKNSYWYEAYDMDKLDPWNPDKAEQIIASAQKLKRKIKEVAKKCATINWAFEIGEDGKKFWIGQAKGLDDYLKAITPAERGRFLSACYKSTLA